MVEAAAAGRLKDQAKTLATVLFLVAGGLICLFFGEGWVRIGGTAIGFVLAIGIAYAYSETTERVVLEGETLRVHLGFGLRRAALPLSELGGITLGSPDGKVAEVASLRFASRQVLLSPAFFPGARALLTQLISRLTLGIEVPMRAGPGQLMGFQRFSQAELNSSLGYFMPSGAVTLYLYERSSPLEADLQAPEALEHFAMVDEEMKGATSAKYPQLEFTAEPSAEETVGGVPFRWSRIVSRNPGPGLESFVGLAVIGPYYLKVRCTAEKGKPARAELRSLLTVLAPKLAAGARKSTS